jgi:transcription antitermination protein NusB
VTESPFRLVRQATIEALYEIETSDHEAEEAYERRVAEMAEEDPRIAEPGPKGLGKGMLRGVLRMKPEIDKHIQDAATQYPIETLAIVDRNILRLAIWELLTDNSAPVAAVVNEAVELAHRYGGDSSPGFVNGVLRTVSQRIHAAQAAVQDDPQDAVSQTNLTPQ